MDLRDKIYLIGFSATGKSHSGRLAAQSLDADFVDMDRLIVTRVGKEISEIFADEGEEAFRRIERDLLPGQSVKAKLPQGYSAEWTLSEASGRPQVRQELTNPKKKKSVLRLKTRPFVTELSKITDDEDAFVLVVDFNKRVHTNFYSD